MLAAELSATLGLATVNVVLGPGDGEAAAFVARLVAALTRSRLVDTATAVRSEQGHPRQAADAFATALVSEREAVLVIVDDAHLLGREAVELLARCALDLPSGHRLLILARHLPGRLASLGDSATLLGADELAFTSEEVAELARAVGAALAPADVEGLWRTTAGWAAPLLLALESVARSAEPERELAGILSQHRPLGYLVSRQLDELDHVSQQSIVQLAHLPRLSPAIAEAVSGDRRLLDRAAASGLPLSVRADGWWELPGPVREHLQRIAPLEARAASAAAGVYARTGELTEALHLLVRAGEVEQAAALLAGISPQQADDLGYLELKTLIDSLASETVERHPRALLHLARTCEPAAQTRLRDVVLSRAADAAESAGDVVLLRELGAERARDLARDGRADEAEQLAQRLLGETGPDELATRARLLDVMGRAAAWRRVDDESLARAELLLREAYALCRRLGERSWAWQVVLPLAHGVYFVRGRHSQAIERFEEALSELPARSAHRGVILSFYADALVDCGRFEQAEAAIEEERRLGSLLGDHRISAYATWSAAKLASQVGDATRTLAELRATEAERHDWFDHLTGVTFLADAADLLDRVGEHAAAHDYLARAQARRDEEPLGVATAEAAVLARSGDPGQAETKLDELEVMPRLEPRERWRLTMLRAYARYRSGELAGAGMLAAAAFEQAAALGDPSLALVRERRVAEALIGAAAAAGSTAATRLSSGKQPLSISVLGHFEVRRSGQLVTLPVGKPAQLVKLLAVSGQQVPAELAIEALWPEAEPASGRQRLRNALHRLRGTAPGLVERVGDLLVLCGAAEIDVVLFERDARSALEAGEHGSARLAVARYRGPLLPDDRYEDWAATPRERLDRLMLALLDAAAAAARRAGDTDEALRCIERAVELDPYDESRYLRGAELLIEQGRRGAALALLARGEQVLASLGVPVTAAHHELVATIRA